MVGGLGVLGVTLDVVANAGCEPADDPVRISSGDGPAVLVVATDEERMIARETARALS